MSNPLSDPRAGGAIFFPRPDMPCGPAAAGAYDHLFDTDDGVRLRLRIFPAGDDAPVILFFHGNGETGRDYDPLTPAFVDLPATLAIGEYRGYGPCTGTPSLLTFLDDAHATLDELRRVLPGRAVVVMGRSLGSAPAIELASARADDLAGLIAESGFARMVPLLELIGLPAASLGITEEHGPENLRKVGEVTLPTLIIHARNDELIPFADAELLHGASADPDHEFMAVPGAGHNDIQFKAGAGYFEAIARLLGRIG